MTSLSEELVEVVAPLLIEDGLFLTRDVETYKAKLATGAMKAEDWLMAVENALAKEEAQ
ncbi:hypothetical protein [Pseudoxanthomonas spadix]|jgi:hypothetical protein|uniref:hypothetical protein n=1 Tax=Pseudoxanthomonas spadix TaxID=415229 RepID=UPI0014728FF6|nr:hypothetical protein [Pseudoxanthomonas spadix]MBP3975391.1 hypothetical protein [Pseudoxanthomonas spadix]